MIQKNQEPTNHNHDIGFDRSRRPTDLEELTWQCGIWAIENFGASGDLRGAAPLLGMIEEYFYEFHDAQDPEKAVDAFADFYIFLAQFCHLNGISLAGVRWPTQSSVATWNSEEEPRCVCPAALIGKICHHVLKFRQKVRVYGDNISEDLLRRKFVGNVYNLVYDLINAVALHYYEYDYAQNLEDAVLDTWMVVRERNYKTHPTNPSAGNKVATGKDLVKNKVKEPSTASHLEYRDWYEDEREEFETMNNVIASDPIDRITSADPAGFAKLVIFKPNSEKEEWLIQIPKLN